MQSATNLWTPLFQGGAGRTIPLCGGRLSDFLSLGRRWNHTWFVEQDLLKKSNGLRGKLCFPLSPQLLPNSAQKLSARISSALPRLIFSFPYIWPFFKTFFCQCFQSRVLWDSCLLFIGILSLILFTCMGDLTQGGRAAHHLLFN